MQWVRRHPVLLSIGLFLIAFNVLYYFFSPRDIVAYVGVENTYVVTFLVAAIGGLSTLTGAVLYTAIATFAAGGSMPWLLGITGGLGIFISDSIFFHLARIGREHVPDEWEPWVMKIQNIIQRYPRRLVLLLAYLYLGFSPFPSDLLMITLALGGYRYRTLAPVLLAGSITIAFLIAYFGNLWL